MKRGEAAELVDWAAHVVRGPVAVGPGTREASHIPRIGRLVFVKTQGTKFGSGNPSFWN